MHTERTKDPTHQVVEDLYKVNGVLYCMNCFVNLASSIHEIVPRSQRPNDWWEIENRIPLCTMCHGKVHEHGSANSADMLRARRAEFISIFK